MDYRHNFTDKAQGEVVDAGSRAASEVDSTFSKGLVPVWVPEKRNWAQLVFTVNPAWANRRVRRPPAPAHAGPGAAAARAGGLVRPEPPTRRGAGRAPAGGGAKKRVPLREPHPPAACRAH